MRVNRLLIDRFLEWRRGGRPLVLATVVSTQGSTYRKTGAQMLLSPEGDFEGLLSGGCLEGDLLEHARAVAADGVARTVTYDFSDPDQDELWGLGLGCRGLTSVLLQMLEPSREYLPFSAVADLARSSQDGVQLLVVGTRGDDDVPVGASAVFCGRRRSVQGMPEALADALREAAERELHGTDRCSLQAGELDVLALRMLAPLKLLILGGGPDVLPLYQLADRLGWDCAVYDHRPAYTARLRAQGVERVHDLLPGEPLPEAATAGVFAAVVMSHHLPSDQHYLRCLAERPVPYVGLLGPAARREHLLGNLGPQMERFAGRLRGPVGFDLGGEGPEAIALAVLAEVQAVSAGRSGGSLSLAAG